MNEQELKHAFREVVASSPPPPSMSPQHALDLAHKARSKRRSSLIGAVVAVLVVGVGIGSAFAFNPKSTDEPTLGEVTSSTLPGRQLTAAPGRSYEPTHNPSGWDMRAGRNDIAPDAADVTPYERLMHNLQALGSANGYQTSSLKLAEGYEADLLGSSGKFVVENDVVVGWNEYYAQVPLRKDGKVGNIVAHVSAPKPPKDQCELGSEVLSVDSYKCKMVDVGGKKVGVGSYDDGVMAGHWATYQAPSGVYVTIAVWPQPAFLAADHPRLDALPLTDEQLAQAAADPRFLLGN